MNCSRVQFGHVFVVAGPSAAGKTTLVDAALEQFKNQGLELAQSVTTRAPRTGAKDPDRNGQYEYITEKAFTARQSLPETDQNSFIETSKFSKSWYGTARKAIEPYITSRTEHRIKSVDLAGAKRLKEIYGNAITFIFVRPQFPGMSILEGLRARLESREKAQPENTALRLASAQAELEHAESNDKHHTYDVIIDNHDNDLESAKTALFQAIESKLAVATPA